MKNRVHREKMEYAWGASEYKLIGKKGTRIYVEERENHLPDMKRITEDGEFLLKRIHYLVAELPGKVDLSHFREFRHFYGMTVRELGSRMELAYHHPAVYSTTFLSVLEQLGYIRRVWKEIPNEKGEFPFYVNPRGWQWIYNVGHLVRKGIFDKKEKEGF